jgi:hypothetical protein
LRWNGNDTFDLKSVTPRSQSINDCGCKAMPTGLARCRNINDASGLSEARPHIGSTLLKYCVHDTRDHPCWRGRADLIGDNAQLSPLTR